MNFKELLKALGLSKQCDIETALRLGIWTIRFDGRQDLTLEIYGDDPRRHTLQMHAPIGQAAEDGRDVLFSRLLQLHLFGLATDQASFGFDAEHNAVLLFKCVALWTCTLDEMLLEVERFVSQTELWQALLPELTHGEPAGCTGALENAAGQHSAHTRLNLASRSMA